MTAPSAEFRRPTAVEALFNRVFGWLIRRGLGLSHNYLVEVRGRKTGRVYATPVDVLSHAGKRYLVAPRGETQWVRNARVHGSVTLVKGSRRDTFGLRVVPDAEKPELLQAYLDRFKTTVQRYFPVPAGSPPAAFAPLAGRYPVFELVTAAPAAR